MKSQFRIILLTAVLAFAAGAVTMGVFRSPQPGESNQGQSEQEASSPAFFTCSMHPHIKQPTPGKCPLCAMDLIPVFEGQGSGDASRELTMSADAMKLAEVESVEVERKFVTAEVRMVGKVEYDETKLAYITAWVPGRLERLFVDYTGVSVQQGDHLVELYSPELLQAQEELISVMSTASDLSASQSDFIRSRRETNIASAREKLRLWGLSEEQIDQIERQGKGSDQITINSPISGVVVHKNAVEGMYVQTGTQVYTIADLSEVWVKLDAYESDLPWLHYGQEVEFSTDAFPGEVFKGQVAFIDPILDSKTRTVKIRVNLPNPDGKLKPDMFVRAVVRSQVATGGRVMDVGLAGKWISPMHPEIIKDTPGACDICGMDLVSAESLGYVAAETDRAPLVIPASAPLITGRRAVVYVDLGAGRFEGREISLGARAGDYYLVEGGLREGERVVTKGNFKIDSAIQILAKPSMMNPDGGAGASEPLHGDSQTHANEQELHPPKYSSVEPFLNQIGGLIGAYTEITDELSHDRFESALQQQSGFREALDAIDLNLLEGQAQDVWKKRQGELEAGIRSFSEAEDLAAARDAFEPISNALIQTVREFGAGGAFPVLLYHCPMAFEGRGGDWLQTSEGTENPYYGSKMFRCGSLQETLVPTMIPESSSGHEGHEHD